MFEGFPYTNFHELNLDWIIKIAKDFLDQYTNIQQTITQGLEDLDTKAQQLQALLDAWYVEHSEDIANQLADALEDLNTWYTTHQGYLDQYLTDSISAFNTAADAKAAETIASIPDDYTALSNQVTTLSTAFNQDKKQYYESDKVHYDKLHKALAGDNIVDFLPLTFINGSWRNRTINQRPVPDDITITTPIIEKWWGDNNIVVTVPAGYKALVAYYNSNGAYVEYVPGTGYTEGTFTVNILTGAYMVIEIRKTDNSSLDASDFDASSVIASVGSLDNIPMLTAGNSAVIALKNRKSLDIWGLRKTLPVKYSKVNLPAFAFLSGYDIPLFSNGYNYLCGADLAKYKNASANTVRVSNSTELASALNAASSGDTIILEKGAYSAIKITKSINLVSDGAIIERAAPTAFVRTATPNVYRCDNFIASVGTVYDASYLSDGLLQNMVAISDASRLSEPGTYYYNGSSLYVHLYNNDVPTWNNIIVDNGTAPVIDISDITENATVYLEGITVIGGTWNLYAENNATYTALTVIGKNCKFLYSNTFDACGIRGANGLFQDCEAAYAKLDGFNYHKQNNVIANCLEINCYGHDNGLSFAGQADTSHNGSTMHDGGKAVRIGGVYYDNCGGNVADISTGTESYCYDCLAFDSKATGRTSGDFWCDTTATIYLYGCRAIGDSEYSLRCMSGTIYWKDCEFINSIGNVIEL